MRSSFKRCTSCGRYTLKAECPSCGSSAANPIPMRFSPDDRYGDYRRKAIAEEWGENGKYRNI
ncbi:MAG: RNA-protein complex protein Nop10 [Candidatus Methanoplasma sp.]|nr:RNA-protein complex protein Nop10 [Candidatus Methanoplasma sp.]